MDQFILNILMQHNDLLSFSVHCRIQTNTHVHNYRTTTVHVQPVKSSVTSWAPTNSFPWQTSRSQSTFVKNRIRADNMIA